MVIAYYNVNWVSNDEIRFLLRAKGILIKGNIQDHPSSFRLCIKYMILSKTFLIAVNIPGIEWVGFEAISHCGDWIGDYPNVPETRVLIPTHEGI